MYTTYIIQKVILKIKMLDTCFNEHNNQIENRKNNLIIEYI